MIRVGTAGWDYPDWQGVVFPKPKPKGFDPLAYLAGYFNTIEINSTFYRPATAKVAASWADRVQDNRDFRFTAKLWRRFTHERATAWTAEEVTAAREALDVLHERQRLGAVLLQFPWSFRKDDTNQEWLRDLFARVRAPAAGAGGAARLAGTRPEVLEWLAEQGRRPGQRRPAAVLELDQPAAHATSPVAYVRLHGRNYKEWFRKAAGRDERYDYLYTPKELAPWVERIRELASEHRGRLRRHQQPPRRQGGRPTPR